MEILNKKRRLPAFRQISVESACSRPEAIERVISFEGKQFCYEKKQFTKSDDFIKTFKTVNL